MGLIKEIQEISYNQTKAQQLKEEKEKQKQLEEDLKKDVKRLIRYGLELVYKGDYDFVYVYNSKSYLLNGIEKELKEIKDNENNRKYYFSDYDISEYIEEQFEKEFDRFKRVQEKVRKLQKEQDKQQPQPKQNILNNVSAGWKLYGLSLLSTKAVKRWVRPNKYNLK